MADSAAVAKIAAIRALASKPEAVKTTKTVEFDLMALRLTKDDICTEIVSWIDGGGRVKPTTLHSFPGRVGNAAYEMKPTINGSLIYIKVTIDKLASGEEMLIISSHRDH
jgi:hypothetical protein